MRRTLIAAAVLTMAACSAVGKSTGASGNAAAHSATGTPVAWMGSDPTDAFMVQITRQGATLSGTFDDTGLPNVGATTTTPLHASFTGTLDGTAMTLTSGGRLGSTSIAGTLTTDAMTLMWPQNDGSIASLTLKPSTVDDYNRKAAAIPDTASANAQASMAAGVRQANQAQVDSAADTVGRDTAPSPPSEAQPAPILRNPGLSEPGVEPAFRGATEPA